MYKETEGKELEMPYSEEEIEEMSGDGRWFRSVLAMVTTGPEEQVSQTIKDECEAVLATDPTEGECYDKLVNLSTSSCCSTSPWAKALCAVDEHYSRPSD